MQIKPFEEVMADSSFYMCFLDDINRPDILQKFVNEFDFYMTPLLNEEISKSKNYKYIVGNKNMNFINFTFDFGEIIKAFFSEEEVIKGEHQVIATAHVLYEMGNYFCFILDESEQRKFVQRNLPYLCQLMTGTVNFVGICCCSCSLLRKDEAIEILGQIKKSKFRVTEEIINRVITTIQGNKNAS